MPENQRRPEDQRYIDKVQADKAEIDQWLSGNGAWIILVVTVGVGVLFLLSLVGVHF